MTLLSIYSFFHASWANGMREYKKLVGLSGIHLGSLTFFRYISFRRKIVFAEKCLVYFLSLVASFVSGLQGKFNLSHTSESTTKPRRAPRGRVKYVTQMWKGI